MQKPRPISIEEHQYALEGAEEMVKLGLYLTVENCLKSIYKVNNFLSPEETGS